MEIKQKTKKNGQVVYTTSLYLGVDAITGKKVRTTITARTKKEVRIKAEQKRSEFNRNGSTVYKEVKMTYYHELAQHWFESYQHDLKPNSLISLRSILKNHILPAFGQQKLSKITPMLIQTVVNNWVAAAKAKQTSNHRIEGVFANYKLLHSYNKKILDYGVAMQVLGVNPALKVVVPKPLKLDSDKVQFLETTELKIFLKALNDLDLDDFGNLQFKTVCHLALASGGRVGELAALDWKDLPFEEKKAHINKTLNNKGEVNSPKSKASHRSIDLDDTTIELLKYYRMRQRAEAIKLTRIETNVFSDFSGTYPNLNVWRQRLKNFAEKAGLKPFTFHAFRHTHASLLINAGINYKELQHRLGHAKITTTMDIYGHLFEETQKTTATLYEQTLKAL